MLTAVPVARPSHVDRSVARGAMLLAPIAVLPLGLGVTVVCWAGPRLGVPGLAVGLLAVGLVVLGNRAFHVDGLSDTADGLTASHDPERSLAVMKTGTSGPAGGAAVLIVLSLQAVGFAALSTSGNLAGSLWPAVVAGLAVCASRCALTLTCARGVPGARTQGLGELYVGTVPWPAMVGSWLVAAVLLTLATLRSGATTWWQAPLACGVAILAVGWLIRRTVRRFGGVTGDVFGAAIELALAALLVALA